MAKPTPPARDPEPDPVPALAAPAVLAVQNVSPLGDLDVPLLRRVVKAGEVVVVTPEQATALLAQTGAWAPAPTAEGATS